MAEPPRKKAKPTTSCALRERTTIQLEVEPGVKGCLNRLCSRLQNVKSSLGIHQRTPQGNVLMMERLVAGFQEEEKKRMARFDSSVFSGFPATSLLDTWSQTDVPQLYVLATGENSTGSFDIHTRSRADKSYFLVSYDAVKRLMETMAHYNRNCPLCGYSLDMSSFAVQQHGHCARGQYELCCWPFLSVVFKFDRFWEIHG